MSDTTDSSSSGCAPRITKIDDYSYDVLNVSTSIFTLISEVLESDIPNQDKQAIRKVKDDLCNQKSVHSHLYLRFKDVHLLQKTLKAVKRNAGLNEMYLHEVMLYCDAKPVLPGPVPEERSPELEARMEKLRRKFAEEEYQKMTKGISQRRTETESVGKELRKMDRQVMFMFNFVITVLAAFAFGYKATEYSLSTPNISLQLIVGVVLATVVFFADVYFIIKDYDKDAPSLNMEN